MNFDFEQELQESLKRKEPAKGFAERVLRQAEHSGIAQQPRKPVLRSWASLAVAASLFASVFGVMRYEEYRKGEQAKNQLMLALRITAKTFDTVERKLRD